MEHSDSDGIGRCGRGSPDCDELLGNLRRDGFIGCKRSKSQGVESHSVLVAGAEVPSAAARTWTLPKEPLMIAYCGIVMLVISGNVKPNGGLLRAQ